MGKEKTVSEQGFWDGLSPLDEHWFVSEADTFQLLTDIFGRDRYTD